MDTKKLGMPAAWLATAALLMGALFAPVAVSAQDGTHDNEGGHENCPSTAPQVGDHGSPVGDSHEGCDEQHSYDPCASEKPDGPTDVTHHDAVCPSPSAVPSEVPSASPSEVPSAVPSEVPSASPSNSPGGGVEDTTGSPAISLPPTDGGAGAAAAASRSWTTLLLAVAGLLASVLVLTPMAIRRRR
jgi:hypothetical protein